MITIKPQDVTVFKEPLMMMVKLGIDEGMANYFANKTSNNGLAKLANDSQIEFNLQM